MSTVTEPRTREERPRIEMTRTTPRSVPLAAARSTRAVDSDVAVFIGFFFAVIVVRLLLSIRRLLSPHWQAELANWGGASKTDSA